MQIYLGNNQKWQVRIDNQIYNLHLGFDQSAVSPPPVTPVGVLKSIDNYTLTDINGLLLSSKESEI